MKHNVACCSNIYCYIRLLALVFGSGLDSGSLIGVSCSSFCWSDVPASTTFSLSLPNPFIAKVVPAAKITSSKNHKIF